MDGGFTGSRWFTDSLVSLASLLYCVHQLMFSLLGIPAPLLSAWFVLWDVHMLNLDACSDCSLAHCFEKDSEVTFGFSGNQYHRQSVSNVCCKYRQGQ
jgi:hypothetical protein